MNKRHLITALALVLLPLFAVAQNGINVPYARFGLGLGEQPFNMPTATRLGGALYTRSASNTINPFNPASYGGIGMQSFVFDMGLNIQMSRLSDQSAHLSDADGNIGYLAIGLPVTRWWKVAAGLMPYTNAEFESVYTDEAQQVRTVYDGSGGASQVFVGSAFNIPVGDAKGGRSLQLGFNVSLITGHVQRAVSYDFIGSDTTYYLNSRSYRHTKLSNVLLDFGLQFRQPLGKGYVLGVAAVMKPYMDMTVADEALKYTYHPSNETLVDTIFPAAGQESGFKSRLEQASTFGFGLSIEREKQWMVSAEATFAPWNGLRYTEDAAHAILGADGLAEGKYGRYAVAFERIGDMDGASYWRRISWSVGAHTTQGLMHLDLGGAGSHVDEWGVGGGVALPMRKGRSVLNLAVGYSSMGSADLLRRQCLTFGIGVGSCERWFVKRKYN